MTILLLKYTSPRVKVQVRPALRSKLNLDLQLTLTGEHKLNI